MSVSPSPKVSVFIARGSSEPESKTGQVFVTRRFINQFPISLWHLGVSSVALRASMPYELRLGPERKR